jgi:hypothetical protein
MRKTLRLAVVALSAGAALAVAGQAFATPKLTVGGLSAQGSSQVSVQLTEDRTDPAPARIVIYAPSGYTGTVTATPDTVLGTAHADLQALAISPDAIIQADGQIIAADPAANVNNVCAPGLHTAVWVIRVTVSGQTIDVPVYVDAPVPAADPLAGTAPFRMTMCFSSPYVGTDVGGAPFGAKIINAQLNFNQGMLTTPVARGSYVWRAVVTPYNVGGGLPNVAGTVEARGIVRTPTTLSIGSRVLNKKRHQIRVTGVLRSGGTGIAAATVRMTGSSKKSARTNVNGAVTYTLRFKKKGRYSFKLATTVPARDVTAAGCATPTAPTLRCVSATANPFVATSKTIRVRV